MQSLLRATTLLAGDEQMVVRGLTMFRAQLKLQKSLLAKTHRERNGVSSKNLGLCNGKAKAIPLPRGLPRLRDSREKRDLEVGGKPGSQSITPYCGACDS